MKNTITKLLLTTAVLALLTSSAYAALNWDGQSGVFLNSLAYTSAPGTTETATHYADLGKLGSVSTYSITTSLKSNIELGYTRYASSVTGVSDQNIIHGKWQFLKESKSAPAAAFSVIYRDLVDGDNTAEIAVNATKIVIIDKHALILDLGARSTKAVGLGLFGVADKSELKFEGSLAYFVTPKFIVGTEFKQQINSRPWRDIAARYIVSDKLNLDVGIANFGTGLDNQIALGATYKL